jgi:hypothetical protein
LSPEDIQQIKSAREVAKSKNKKRKVAAVMGNAMEDETAHDERATANPLAEDVASNGNNFGTGAYNTRNSNKWVGINNNQHQDI